MGLIDDIGGVWSKSGSNPGSFIDKTLNIAEKVVNTTNQVANIFTTAKEHNAVIHDYRKASVHLPKYYKEDGLEEVATISIVNAVESDTEDTKGNISKNQFVNDLLSGKAKDTFILKNVQELFVERHQVVETFGEDFAVFLTGEKPKIFGYSGVLVNDAYRGWKSSFIAAYQDLLRGSELAKRRRKVSLTYDYVTVQGYIIELATNTESSDDVNVSFTFQMLITDYEDLGIEMFSETPTYGGQLGWSLESSAFLQSGVGGIYGLASRSTSTISEPLDGSAFGAKAAASSSNAPDTASLLDTASSAVSGDFGDMVLDIDNTNKEYSNTR